MASLIRCDLCKRLNDEPGMGYIGKDWRIKEYQKTHANIQTEKDLCRECVKKIVNENQLVERSKDYE